MSNVESVAGAVTESAKLGQQALQTSEKAGGFIARVFKEPIEHGVGMLSDRLAFLRWRGLCNLADKVNRILDERGVKDTRAVPPKLAVPLLEAAAVEDEPELQSLWAKLLANAMDSGFAGELRPAFADIIKGMSPIDARIVVRLYDLAAEHGRNSVERIGELAVWESRICNDLSIKSDDYKVAVTNLMRLRCVAPQIVKVELKQGLKMSRNEPLTIDKGTDCIVLTPLGVRFIEACGAAKPVNARSYDHGAGISTWGGTVTVSQDMQPAAIAI